MKNLRLNKFNYGAALTVALASIGGAGFVLERPAAFVVMTFISCAIALLFLARVLSLRASWAAGIGAASVLGAIFVPFLILAVAPLAALLAPTAGPGETVFDSEPEEPGQRA